MMRVSALRYPLFAVVLLMMLAGGWAALLRAGIALPTLTPALVGMHGPLMIGGVFGALISLERAVAVSSLLQARLHWSFLAPFLAATGGVLLVVQGASPAAKLCLLGASALLTLVYAHTATVRHFWSLHTAIMTLGAALWFTGNLVWLTGAAVPVLVYGWMGFIVLTIVGERLELSRVLRLTKRSERLLIIAVAVYVVGTLLAFVDLAVGARAAGAGAILIGMWLLRYDLAGRQLRQSGLTRYIAVCLFSGYLWLVIAGIFAIGYGAVYGGYPYDAIIHALVGGFVFSMVFGHAPLIFPALTGRQIAFSSAFYLPLALLHLSILLREISNLSASFQGRMWASGINAAAVLLFMALVALAAVRFGR
jgi:hypothetical protein